MADVGIMLGIDIGTGGCKITILDSQGRTYTSSREYATYSPQPFWCEQNPEDWYEALKTTLEKTLRQAGAQAKDIISICVDGQPHTPVFLNEEMEILRPAIPWTDQRSVRQVELLKNVFGKRVHEITCEPTTTTFTLPQVLWVKENQPDIWRSTHKLQIAKDFVRLKLTDSGWFTDPTDAMGTLMFDVKKFDWSEEICETVGISVEKLPEIRPSIEVVGSVTAKASRETSLPEGTPVIMGCHDVAAEQIAAGAIQEGQCTMKLATAAAIGVITEKPTPDPKGQMIVYCQPIPDRWWTGWGTNACGMSYRWFRDTFCKEEVDIAKKLGSDPYEIMDAKAAQAPVGSDGLIYHPYLAGERAPYWDPHLRGDFVGITVRHKKEHFCRAVLEGVAFSLRDCYEGFKELGFPAKEVRLIGGGAKSTLWRQIICDVLGFDVSVPLVGDASFGSALLSGIGAGIFRNTEEATKKCVKIAASTKPRVENHIEYEKLFAVYRQVHDNLVESNHLLSTTGG